MAHAISTFLPGRSFKGLSELNFNHSVSWNERVNLTGPNSLRRKIQTLSQKNDPSTEEKETSIQLYRNIEGIFSKSARLLQDGKGLRTGRWQEVEGSWIISPTSEPSFAVVHFVGGAFVGASPQLVYRLFLETLADRGVTVVATPYASGFDHFRIADETQFKFDSAFRSFSRQNQHLELESLPVFGMGHSLGALTHVLIGSRYGVQRQGNVLLSFNNREASAAIPALSSTLIPLYQRVGPLLASGSLQLPISLALKQLEGMNPELSRNVRPILDQLPALYKELEKGDSEFVPSPQQTDSLVKAYYGVKKNLLVSFQDDSLDESDELATVLRASAQVGPTHQRDVSVRKLPGTHTRPLQQPFPELPTAMADAISQGASLLSALAATSPLAGLAGSMASRLNLEELSRGAAEDIALLADEVVQWMEAANKSAKFLPPHGSSLD